MRYKSFSYSKEKKEIFSGMYPLKNVVLYKGGTLTGQMWPYYSQAVQFY